MCRLVPLLLVLAACAAQTPRQPPALSPPSPANGPVLEELKAPSALEPSFAALITQRLPELRQCVAVTFVEGARWAPITSSSKLDDRVEVSLRVNTTRAGSPSQKLQVKASAQLSDTACVEHWVSAWPFSDEQLDALAAEGGERSAGLTFRYRFRPTAQMREAKITANQKALMELCSVFEGAKPDQSLEPAYNAGRDRIRFDLQAILDPLMSTASAFSPKEFGQLTAATFRMLGEQLAVTKPCRAFRGWLAYSDAELMDAAPLPDSSSCALRVEQMKKLGATFSPAPAGLRAALESPRARKLTEPGLLIDATSAEAEAPLVPSKQLVDRLARAQAEEQKRPRPIAYVRVGPSEPARKLLEGVLAWSARFDVRLLLIHTGPTELIHAADAWPPAVALLQEQLSELRPQERPRALMRSFADAGLYCAGAPKVIGAISTLDEDQQLAALAAGLAEAIDHCGCPNAWSEAAWARLALLADAWDAGAGWLPLPVTKKASAPALELAGDATVEALLAVLPETPFRVVWK